MPPIKTLQELNALKEQLKPMLKVREGEGGAGKEKKHILC